MIVGYARVSTDGQTLDAQQAALREAGCAKVFADKICGAVTDRPALAKAIGGLGDGDTLVVCKLDRLARSTRDLLRGKIDLDGLTRDRGLTPSATAHISFGQKLSLPKFASISQDARVPAGNKYWPIGHPCPVTFAI